MGKMQFSLETAQIPAQLVSARIGATANLLESWNSGKSSGQKIEKRFWPTQKHWLAKMCDGPFEVRSVD
jgi:hypothetical protein